MVDVNGQLAEAFTMEMKLDELAGERERQMERGMLETGMSCPLFHLSI